MVNTLGYVIAVYFALRLIMAVVTGRSQFFVMAVTRAGKPVLYFISLAWFLILIALGVSIAIGGGKS